MHCRLEAHVTRLHELRLWLRYLYDASIPVLLLLLIRRRELILVGVVMVGLFAVTSAVLLLVHATVYVFQISRHYCVN